MGIMDAYDMRDGKVYVVYMFTLYATGVGLQ